MDDNDASLSGTLARGLAVLDLLAAGERPTAADIVARLDLSRSATYRVLGALRQHGLIDWEAGSTGEIVPGETAIKLGMAGLANFDPYAAGRAHIADLSAEVGEAVLMAVVDGDDIVYIAHEDHSRHTVGVRRLLGVRRPLATTSLGKAYLAALPVAECDAWIDQTTLVRVTDRTITDKGQLRREIDAARLRGYAIDDSENDVGVMCFGAAVRDSSGRPLASVSVAGPIDRMQPREPELSGLLLRTVEAISRRLGYTESTPLQRRA